MRNFRHDRFALAIGGALAVTALVASVTPSGASSRAQLAGARPAKVSRVTTVSFVGHGYGPGIGMGQWGDFGYAVRYHFGYERILNHYYSGTTATSLTTLGMTGNPTISVVLLENANLTTNVGYDTVVTSPTAYSIESSSPTVTGTGGTLPTPSGATGLTGNTGASGVSGTGNSGVSGASGNSGTTAPTLPAPPAGSVVVGGGTAIDLRLSSNGTWSVYEGNSCTTAERSANQGAPVLTGLVNPVVSPASSSATAPSVDLLTVCRHDGIDETVRGQVQAYDRDGYERTINLLPLQSYLDGVVPAEESASWGLDGGTVGAPQGEPWGFQALEAQAVAARSYAMAYSASGGWNGYADICDTTLCQAYVGANFENAVSSLAVSSTSGEVRTQSATNAGATGTGTGSSTIVDTRYSASTGGFTAPGSFAAVTDMGDACAVPGVASQCNPNHTWRTTMTAASIVRHYRSIGTLTGLRVSARNGYGSLGGRALQVTITGTRSTVHVTASAFASAIGLRSDWFAVRKLTRRGAAVTTTMTTTSTTSTTVPATTTTLPVTSSTLAGTSTTSTTALSTSTTAAP